MFKQEPWPYEIPFNKFNDIVDLKYLPAKVQDTARRLLSNPNSYNPHAPYVWMFYGGKTVALPLGYCCALINIHGKNLGTTDDDIGERCMTRGGSIPHKTNRHKYFSNRKFHFSICEPKYYLTNTFNQQQERKEVNVVNVHKGTFILHDVYAEIKRVDCCHNWIKCRNIDDDRESITNLEKNFTTEVKRGIWNGEFTPVDKYSLVVQYKTDNPLAFALDYIQVGKQPLNLLSGMNECYVEPYDKSVIFVSYRTGQKWHKTTVQELLKTKRR